MILVLDGDGRLEAAEAAEGLLAMAAGWTVVMAVVGWMVAMAVGMMARVAAVQKSPVIVCSSSVL